MTETKVFAAGDVLAREGEQGDEAYKIVSGFVKITQQKDGRDMFIRQCGPGQIIGEMALLEDRPRTATITATSEVEVAVISEALLSEELGKLSPVITDLIVELCDRIKEKDKDWMGAVSQVQGGSEPGSLELIAESDAARAALGSEAVTITEFPCRIGRPSSSFFARRVHRNDIDLSDQKPHQVSRSHLTLDFGNDIFAVIDRNSKLGATVNGTRIGGDAEQGWAGLKRGDNELIIGAQDSPLRFVLRV